MTKSKRPDTELRCAKCKQIKPNTEFPPCKTVKRGYYAYCKPCHAEYQSSRHPNRIVNDEKLALVKGLKKQGLKRCSSCTSIFKLDNFYADPRHTDGKQSICKECWTEKGNVSYLMREYGLTLEDYTKLLIAQDGVCAICGRAPKKYKFNIDHCHKTHRVRALLCVNCNTNLLPYVERFPVWVKKAFEYLENPPAFAIIGERMVPETNQSRKKENIR